MKGQIYEPQEGKYDLPIFVNDCAIPSFTWKELIDTYVANNGHKADEELFRELLMEIMQFIADDVVETFELCKENILKEVSEGET